MKAKKKETKIVRGYSLSPVNVKWLKEKAVGQMILAEDYVSVSEALDVLLTQAREDELRDARILAKVKSSVKAA